MSDLKTVFGIAISGGGMLGVGPAYFLSRLEVMIGKKLANASFAFSGTSTGSIIAACLAEGMQALDIYDLYDKNLSKIFTKYPWYKRVLPEYPTYDNANLKKILQKYLKGNVGDWKKPIFIPVTTRNQENQEKVFDNGDKTTEKWFAVMASCAAPTYFQSLERNGVWYADGGLWLNNPVTALGAGAVKKYGLRPEQFRILSFDTGMTKNNSQYTGNKGLAGTASEILDCWVAHSGKGNCFIASAYHDVMTLSPSIKKEIKMDDVSRKSDVVEIWDKYFEQVGEQVAGWLGI